jgi:hypothetical protein
MGSKWGSEKEEWKHSTGLETGRQQRVLKRGQIGDFSIYSQ